MIKIREGFDPDTNQPIWYDLEAIGINRNSIVVDWQPELIEKKSIGGRIYRKVKGYRLVSSWTYPNLYADARIKLMLYLGTYEKVYIKMDVPMHMGDSEEFDDYKVFEGYVYMTLSSSKKFGHSATLNDYIWSDYTLSVRAVDLVGKTD